MSCTERGCLESPRARSPGGQTPGPGPGSGSANRARGGRIARIHKRNERGETPLHIAARRGEHAQCRRLLEEGADVNSVDYAGQCTGAISWRRAAPS